MTTVEVLEAAKARVENGWCQEAYAKRPDGTRCPPWHSKAVAWCMDGAVRVTVEDDDGVDVQPARAIVGAYAKLRDAVGGVRHVWNDTPGRTQAEVLDAFSRAIALARRAS